MQFTLFGPAEGLKNAAIYDLLEDRGGRYWIATGGGVYRFTPSPREFLHVREQHAASAAPASAGPASAGSAPIGDASGATSSGASRAAMVLLEDREGTIWCGSSERLLRVRTADARTGAGARTEAEAGGLAFDEVPLPLDPTEHGRVVGALLEARDGTLWIGTGSGLFRRTRDGRVDRFSSRDGLPDHEIVVERAQYWPDPAPQWYEAHNSFGVTETAYTWGLAEGRVGDAAGYQTYILLANPTTHTATVTITFLRETGAPIVKEFTVNPSSRLNVSIGSGADVPELTNERFGALIESTEAIVVERALYANFGSQVWGAGTNATATRLPEWTTSGRSA